MATAKFPNDVAPDAPESTTRFGGPGRGGHLLAGFARGACTVSILPVSIVVLDPSGWVTETRT